MLAVLCSAAQSTEAGLGHSEVDLMVKICCFLKEFGLLARFVVFGAAQMGDGSGIQCPRCQIRRNSHGSGQAQGNAADAMEDTCEVLMGRR